MDVSEFTVNVVAVPLNRTAVAPVKLVPVMVTLAPTRPLTGVKFVMAGTTAKFELLDAVPPAVVTLIGPVVVPAGTVAWMVVDDVTENVAVRPLNRTAPAPVKFVPLIATLVPTGPSGGEKLAIVGGLITVKLDALVAVPPTVVTLIGPVVAPAGTAVEIVVAEVTENAAAVPLNATAVAPVKSVPVTVTLVPAGPLVGVNPEIDGPTTTVKLAALVAVPAGVVTLNGPVVAPDGTAV
jgi:hypothetical protein